MSAHGADAVAWLLNPSIAQTTRSGHARRRNDTAASHFTIQCLNWSRQTCAAIRIRTRDIGAQPLGPAIVARVLLDYPIAPRENHNSTLGWYKTQHGSHVLVNVD
ncbi:hypothetical protein BST61_g755 [Cercospora zeina]